MIMLRRNTLSRILRRLLRLGSLLTASLASHAAARYFSAATLSVFFYCCFGVSPAIASTCSAQNGADTACQSHADPGTTQPAANNLRHAGNPADVITGAKQQREIDYQAIGTPLHFSRYYYSGRTDSNMGLGAGWRHSYQVSLVAIDDQHLRIQQASGRWVDFYRIQNESDSATYMARVLNDGYIVIDDWPVWSLPDGRALHFNGSILSHIDYANNQSLRLQYSETGLQSVTDKDGRAIVLDYYNAQQALPDFDSDQSAVFSGYLREVKLPSGERLQYNYDSQGNLNKVIDANDGFTQYDYGLNDYPHHLTAITQKSKFTTTARRWYYDGEGRVSRYESPDSRASLDIEYDNAIDNEGFGETLVRYDQGLISRYRWKLENKDEPSRVVEIVSQDCDTCREYRRTPFVPTVQRVEDVAADKYRRLAAITNSGSDAQALDSDAQNDAQNLDAANPDDQSTEELNSVDQTSENQSTEVQSTVGQSSKPTKPTAIPDLVKDITVDGTEYRFIIEFDESGKVSEITVGNTTFTELGRKLNARERESCKGNPRFENSHLDPQPELACNEDISYMIKLHKEATLAQKRATQGVADQGFIFEKPKLTQLEAIPGSLDSFMDITIGGTEHRFIIEVDRTGKVIDITVGNTSMQDLVRKWNEGGTEKCNESPLFERSKLDPQPEKACFTDLLYIMEIKKKIEDERSWYIDEHGNDLTRSVQNSSSQGCQFNPFFTCEELNRNFELAQLSSCAYDEWVVTCGPDWQVVPPAQVGRLEGIPNVGMAPELFVDGDFSSTLFYNAITDEYVLAFRGTDGIGDWVDNGINFYGEASGQYKAAVNLAAAIQTKLPNATLSFTGHSLGGGLATAAALSIGEEATVFNAAGLNSDAAAALGVDVSRANELVDVTTTDGDLLTHFQSIVDEHGNQRNRALGQHTQVPAPDDVWIEYQQLNASFVASVDSVVLHGISSVLQSEASLLQTICGTTPIRA